MEEAIFVGQLMVPVTVWVLVTVWEALGPA